MSKDDALKLALEALEVATTPLAKDRQEVLRARAAIREALAEPPCKTGSQCTSKCQQCKQPAQREPVGWVDDDGTVFWKDKPPADGADLYTSPPASKPWAGLTVEEKNQVAWSCGAMSADWLEFAEAIEAKLKDKNGY